jgi:hypothetical protein
MVLAITNKTGFGCEQLPLTARNGANIMRLVVKASYGFTPGGQLELLAEQPSPVLSDEYWDDPISKDAVRVESDVSLDKPYTDLIVNGHAVAPYGKKVTSMEAGLSFDGRVLRRVRVFGERIWTQSGVGWALTEPLPFEKIPITYARAYGGHDTAGAEARNSFGTGYVSRPSAAFEGARAPNIEDPSRLIRYPSDRPPPAGFGVVARSSQPRAGYAGTYDDKWLEERFPLLPLDFDDRFNQVTDPAQWLPRPRGGETIRIAGMSEHGALAITLPPCQLRAGFH